MGAGRPGTELSTWRVRRDAIMHCLRERPALLRAGGVQAHSRGSHGAQVPGDLSRAGRRPRASEWSGPVEAVHDSPQHGRTPRGGDPQELSRDQGTPGTPISAGRPPGEGASITKSAGHRGAICCRSSRPTVPADSRKCGFRDGRWRRANGRLISPVPSDQGASTNRRKGKAAEGRAARAQAILASTHDEPGNARQAASCAGASVALVTFRRRDGGPGASVGCAHREAREVQVRGHRPAARNQRAHERESIGIGFMERKRKEARRTNPAPPSPSSPRSPAAAAIARQLPAHPRGSPA